MDDVIVVVKTFKDMIRNLRVVFEAGLKLKAKKCILFAITLYLGHVISDKGIATYPEKVKAVRE